jgi:hypothetical protein
MRTIQLTRHSNRNEDGGNAVGEVSLLELSHRPQFVVEEAMAAVVKAGVPVCSGLGQMLVE